MEENEANCTKEETVDEFIEEETSSLLIAFMERLEEPSEIDFDALKNRLEEVYTKKYFDGFDEYLDDLSWWVDEINYYVKPKELKALVKERIEKSSELIDAIRRLYPTGSGLFHDRNIQSFPNEFADPFDEITDISRWEVLQRAHDKILEKVIQIFKNKYPTNLFDERFVRYKTHEDLRDSIAQEATAIIEQIPKDPQFEQLLNDMIAFSTKYYLNMY